MRLIASLTVALIWASQAYAQDCLATRPNGHLILSKGPARIEHRGGEEVVVIGKIGFINLIDEVREAARRPNEFMILLAPPFDLNGKGLPTLPWPIVQENMMTEKLGWGEGVIYQAGRTFMVSSDICILDAIKNNPGHMILFLWFKPIT